MSKDKVRYGILNETVVPINLHPKFDSPLADEGLYGMIVKLLKDEGDGWYYVETSYNYNGYVHESNMLLDEDKIKVWEEEAKHIIIHSLVDVLPEAKYQGSLQQLLTRGATIISTGKEEKDWAEVQLADGSKGWVRKHFVDKKITSYNKDDEEGLRKSLVDTAMLYMGTQYRWGGKSPLGLDCSGLCSISYLLNGIVIYRDAVRKDEYMRKIELEEIKLGDLIFWPGHVAMYIGEDKYVHSSAGNNGVYLNSLNPEDEDYNDYLAKSITDIGTIF